MRLLAVLLVRAAVADMGPDGDQARSAVAAGALDRRLDGRQVVAVLHPLGMPAVRLEAGRDVLGPGHRGRPVELDVVVVVEHDQLLEPEVAGQAGGLGRDPFLEVAVRRDHVGPVVDDRMVRPVELGGQAAFGDGHADGVGQALAERAGGRLDTRRQAVLGVARRDAAPLPERLEILERHGIAGQVEQRVEQHRGMPGRQHEPVAIDPVRVGRCVAQEARPQDVGHRRGAHRRPRMTRVCLLDPIDRQGPDRVDGELVEVGGEGHAIDSGGVPNQADFGDDIVGVVGAILPECRRSARRDEPGSPASIVLGDLVLDVVVAPARPLPGQQRRARAGHARPGWLGREHRPLAGAARARGRP